MTDDFETRLRAGLRDLPREIEPTHDLWPAIAERIDAPPQRRWWPVLLAAGLACLALGTQLVGTPEPIAIHSASAAWAELDLEGRWGSHERYETLERAEAKSPLLPQEREYWLAVRDLDSAFDRQRHRLEPPMLEVLDTQLQSVDRAIHRSRGALAERPDDLQLQRVLDHAYQHKLEILSEANRAARRL